MKGIVQKVVIGTSVLVGMGALAASSALAQTAADSINFSDSNFRTYNGTTLGDITNGNASEAIDALTDDDLYTNVELGIAEGTTTSFTAIFGSDEVTVSGVTLDDWANGLAAKWTADFAAAYPALAGMGSQFGSLFVQRAGDPNVSSLTQADDGTFSMTTVGHYNLLNAPWIASNPQLAVMAQMARTLLGPNPLQVSEITKVVLNGETSYLYSFFAEETGVLAADRSANDFSSHSGLYTSTFGDPKETEDVPEPSILLGLVAAGGLLTASKRKLNQA